MQEGGRDHDCLCRALPHPPLLRGRRGLIRRNSPQQFCPTAVRQLSSSARMVTSHPTESTNLVFTATVFISTVITTTVFTTKPIVLLRQHRACRRLRRRSNLFRQRAGRGSAMVDLDRGHPNRARAEAASGLGDHLGIRLRYRTRHRQDGQGGRPLPYRARRAWGSRPVEHPGGQTLSRLRDERFSSLHPLLGGARDAQHTGRASHRPGGPTPSSRRSPRCTRWAFRYRTRCRSTAPRS
jgi:hypothetical protein